MADNTIVISGTPQAYRSYTPTVATGVHATDLAGTADGLVPDAAIVTVETNPVRVRFDGTNPAAAEGHLLPVGTVLVLKGRDAISKFKMIDTAAGASVVKISTTRGHG